MLCWRRSLRISSGFSERGSYSAATSSTATDSPRPTAADGSLPPPDQRLPIYAIASQEYFQRRFGGNPAALGQPVVKNGPILVGVLERGVELLFRPDKNIERRPDLWMAFRLSPSASRIGLFLRPIARLRPGVTLQQAQAQADAVAEQTQAIQPTHHVAA